MSESEQKPFLRRIRSFVRREGRLTPGQQRALDELWPRFGIEHNETPLDLDAIFGRVAPRVLEIGFGNGASLLKMAQDNPGTDYLGIEVHRPGVGNLLLNIEREGVTNIRVMSEDAVDILKQQIPDASLDRVQLFFPDPWHKKKHHKRRIVQPDFVQLLYKKLKPGGRFHMATDWQHYAEHMLEVMTAAEGFKNISATNDYVERPGSRPLTKFEQRGHRLGHGVWDLIFEKIDA
ncbi:tRNA (guanosine(46)-N7)-methyltransferase TrmB [Sulfuriflexus mobilis]|uniref:tRNA (guanosine(46)-N7)-methyltransferase TrmB n=1 Tax=Sulfuriflexus mobilis TaxID=1811807 RepID=UPI000F8387DF|nr:tRNA (guanosine(46)-N7)-methyltransferase TrmB [Sulfuriflexus mobilis]